MRPQGSVARSQASQGAAAPARTEPPQQKVAKLLQKLDDLLLLNGKELELWEELKAETGKLCSPPQVTADDFHYAEELLREEEEEGRGASRLAG